MKQGTGNVCSHSSQWIITIPLTLSFCGGSEAWWQFYLWSGRGTSFIRAKFKLYLSWKQKPRQCQWSLHESAPCVFMHTSSSSAPHSFPFLKKMRRNALNSCRNSQCCGYSPLIHLAAGSWALNSGLNRSSTVSLVSLPAWLSAAKTSHEWLSCRTFMCAVLTWSSLYFRHQSYPARQFAFWRTKSISSISRPWDSLPPPRHQDINNTKSPRKTRDSSQYHWLILAHKRYVVWVFQHIFNCKMSCLVNIIIP